MVVFVALIALPTIFPKIASSFRSFTSRQTETTASDDGRIEIDKEKVFAILKELQFAEKNLVINKVSTPSDDYGFLIKNDRGVVDIGFRLIGEGDNIIWDIYISDEYLDKNGNYEVKKAKDLKERALTEFALRSFIMSSQEPNRELEILYPVANRPVLFTINY